MQVTAGQPAVPLVGWQSWWVWLVEYGSVCWGPKRAVLLADLDRGGSETVLYCDGKRWLL